MTTGIDASSVKRAEQSAENEVLILRLLSLHSDKLIRFQSTDDYYFAENIAIMIIFILIQMS